MCIFFTDICVFRYFRYDVKLLLFTLAGNSLMEVDSFLVLLAIVRWNQILLFVAPIYHYIVVD